MEELEREPVPPTNTEVSKCFLGLGLDLGPEVDEGLRTE